MKISKAIPVRPKTINPIITTSDNRNFAASHIIQPMPAEAATISAATNTVYVNPNDILIPARIVGPAAGK